MATSCNRKWLWQDRGLSGGDKIVLVKALSGTLPHRINQTRGRKDQAEKKCRKCRNVAETDCHIIAECPATKDLRSLRHNHLCDKIVKDLKQANVGWIVQREQTWTVGQRNFRPDITIIEGNKCLILEITCPYEQSEEYLSQWKREKEAKYEALKREKNQAGCETVDVMTLVIGSLGTI